MTDALGSLWDRISNGVSLVVESHNPKGHGPLCTAERAVILACLEEAGARKAMDESELPGESVYWAAACDRTDAAIKALEGE